MIAGNMLSLFTIASLSLSGAHNRYLLNKQIVTLYRYFIHRHTSGPLLDVYVAFVRLSEDSVGHHLTNSLN